jgi:hypothetical protein
MLSFSPKIKSTFAPPIFIQAPLINLHKEKEKINLFPNRKMIPKIKKNDLKKINEEDIPSISESRHRARIIKLNWTKDDEEDRAEDSLPYNEAQLHVHPPIRGRRRAIRY